MLTKRKAPLKFFVEIALFVFSDSCCRLAQIAEISPLALTVASVNHHLVLHAWCIARQANRNGETVKHFHNYINVLSRLRTPYCTNLRQYSKRPKRGVAHDYAQIPNLQFSLPASKPEKCVGLYKIVAVCCTSHVQESMISSNRFTSIQGKTISRLSEFRVALQNFRVSFWWASLWHPKRMAGLNEREPPGKAVTARPTKRVAQLNLVKQELGLIV